MKKWTLFVLTLIFSVFSSAREIPLQASDVPLEVIAGCKDPNGLVANVNEPYGLGDAIDPESTVPRSHILILCRQPTTGHWWIICEMGGRGVHQLQIKAEKKPAKGFNITTANQPRDFGKKIFKCPDTYFTTKNSDNK